MQNHDPFKDLFTGKSTVKKEYTLRRGVTFYEDKKEFALDLVEKYILPASHEIVGTVQTPFPTGIHDLWFSYHLDKIMTISGRKKQFEEK